MTSSLKELSSVKVWGGYLKKFSHESSSTRCQMKFNIFLPPSADQHQQDQKVPVLYWLSGLTCTEDNFMQKAAVFRSAVHQKIAIVSCDTSPRGLNLPGEKGSWDFGEGAGFYLDAELEPWKNHYRIFTYLTKELPDLIQLNFPVNNLKSIAGHSMGGHGALIAFFKCPNQYQSVSAFAPIAHPSACQWGDKAFRGYLGEDKEKWKSWDATELVLGYGGPKSEILIDQGDADEFLHKGQLLPDHFIAAAKKAGIPVNYRLQAGYDHSYYFIQTFIEDHVNHHAKALDAKR